MAPGLGALGMGGLLGGLGAPPGFVARGGGEGFGLVPKGGAGLLLNELDGLEISSVPADGVFFHGVAEPLDGIMPGNTETGFAEESASRECAGALGVATSVGVCLTLEGAEGGMRRFGGGGGRVTLGGGGASSR